MLGRDKLASEPRTCKRLKRAFQTLPYPQPWPTMRVQVPTGVNESSLGIIASEESCGPDCNRKTNNVTRVRVTIIISAHGGTARPWSLTPQTIYSYVYTSAGRHAWLSEQG